MNNQIARTKYECERCARYRAAHSDHDFIDGVQKQHSKMVGFLYRQAIETYIEPAGRIREVADTMKFLAWRTGMLEEYVKSRRLG